MPPPPVRADPLDLRPFVAGKYKIQSTWIFVICAPTTTFTSIITLYLITSPIGPVPISCLVLSNPLHSAPSTLPYFILYLLTGANLF